MSNKTDLFNFREMKITLEDLKTTEDLKTYLTHVAGQDVVQHLELTHLQQINKLNGDLSSTLCQVNFPF